jgi:hypothetical protein
MPEPDLNRILGRGRLALVIAHLADPQQALDQSTPLTDHERAVIATAIAVTDHPLRQVALGMLEDWDHLAVPDQSAGLLLFATIARNPGHRLTRSRPPTSRGMRLEL